MTSGVRFGAAHARMHALKSRLWTPLDRPLVVGAGLTPDGRALGGTPAEVFPAMVRWYVIFLKVYRSAVPLLRALFRRHEVENLKLLWRAASRGRLAIASCWRPLEPLGVLVLPREVLTPQELIQRLDGTPYGAIARALLRGHAADLPAAEIGLDRWVWSAIVGEASRLPPGERAAAELVRLLTLEHDVNLLRRGTSAGLDADLVAKSTVVLSSECRIGPLAAAAAWRDGDGPLARVLPRPLARVAGEPRGWDDLLRALRSTRLRACRRAFVGWPYRLAPALAALLLREEETYASMRIAAARVAGRHAPDELGLALAASALEA